MLSLEPETGALIRFTRIKELVAAQPVKEGAQERVSQSPSKNRTEISTLPLFNGSADAEPHNVASRSPRRTAILRSRAPIPSSEETTDTRYMAQ